MSTELTDKQIHEIMFAIEEDPDATKVQFARAIIAADRALREQAQQVPERKPCKVLCELCVKRGYDFCANAAETTPIYIAQPAQPQGDPAWDEAFIARLHALGWTVNECPVCGNSVSGTLPPPAHTEEQVQEIFRAANRAFNPDDYGYHQAEFGDVVRRIMGVPAP